jgi:hypothetical protein
VQNLASPLSASFCRSVVYHNNERHLTCKASIDDSRISPNQCLLRIMCEECARVDMRHRFCAVAYLPTGEAQSFMGQRLSKVTSKAARAARRCVVEQRDTYSELNRTFIIGRRRTDAVNLMLVIKDVERCYLFYRFTRKFGASEPCRSKFESALVGSVRFPIGARRAVIGRHCSDAPLCSRTCDVLSDFHGRSTADRNCENGVSWV